MLPSAKWIVPSGSAPTTEELVRISAPARSAASRNPFSSCMRGTVYKRIAVRQDTGINDATVGITDLKGEAAMAVLNHGIVAAESF